MHDNMYFSIQRIDHAGFQVLSVGGRLGDDECYRVENELRQLLEQKHERVILDCSALSFASAMSLARLLTLALSIHRHNGGLRLAGLTPSINRLAQAAGFTREMASYLNVASAIDSFRQAESSSASMRDKTSRC